MHRFPTISAWILLGVACVPPCGSQPADGTRLVSPYRNYTVSLTSFAPLPQVVAGVLLKARINGGPELRLLLDSGAEHIALGSKAAAKSALPAVADFLLVGAGESPTRSARAGTAEKVEIGPVAFANCPVAVVHGRLAGGIDGVVPLSLFGAFLVRLDLSAGTLELVPYGDDPARPTRSSPIAAHTNMLLAKAILDGGREGPVLLDTGAAYSGISRRMAGALRSSPVESLHLLGATGGVAGDVLKTGIRFQIAGREFTADHPVALDLSTISRYNGIEIIGLLGYPELRNAVLTVNYRDAWVSIDLKRGGR